MKILHVAQPVDGGVAGVVISFAKDQQRRGWQPIVVCPPTGVLPEAMRECGVPVASWRATRSPGPSVLGEVRALNRIVRTERPDVVHLHGSKAGLAGRLAVRGKLPTIFQPHLWSFQSDPGPTALPARVWERFAARWTVRTVCVSLDEQAAGRSAGVAGDLTVICNGVDLDRVRPRDRHGVRADLGIEPGGPVAVCVARLAPLKGHDMLLRAWAAVLAEAPTARLLIVGDGPLRDALHRDHPISHDPSVSWLGWSDSPGDYMAAADVVVVPSRAEGMALVPLEAMASARSVVAFDAGGIRHSIGDGGAVLPIGDVAGLADAVAQRLLDTAMADREGAQGRRRVEQHFDQRTAADTLADLTAALRPVPASR
ncbi:glycosyltransferase [Mycobacterium sp. CPCC 205372]|uniref:Glycosyltransferase n=1 Tax=Mycobacterium hippophais TaxID=3016340 RepID=A0ABT4PRV7_9MYCO|nr:glycosyltransferase [Mycobacterium hippophais]MCZ8379300.1 glycosyltransferase [Mycobacterium hippophais]